jgi:hypothetical protein
METISAKMRLMLLMYFNLLANTLEKYDWYVEAVVTVVETTIVEGSGGGDESGDKNIEIENENELKFSFFRRAEAI